MKHGQLSLKVKIKTPLPNPEVFSNLQKCNTVVEIHAKYNFVLTKLHSLIK